MGYRFSLNSSLLISLSLALIMLLLGLISGISEPLLQYDRERIFAGELWRLISGQLVHYGFYHLLMNIAALLLCGYVLLRELSASAYGSLLASSALAVGLGLLAFDPQMDYYAGLSGVLHGLIIAGLIHNWRTSPWFYALALLLVLGKLIQEQLPGFDASHPLLPVEVAVNAHLYGAAGGLVWAIAYQLFIIRSRKESNA